MCSMDEFGENLLGLIKEALQHRTDIQKSCKELQPQDSQFISVYTFDFLSIERSNAL